MGISRPGRAVGIWGLGFDTMFTIEGLMLRVQRPGATRLTNQFKKSLIQ